jgi:hypothetical protein
MSAKGREHELIEGRIRYIRFQNKLLFHFFMRIAMFPRLSEKTSQACASARAVDSAQYVTFAP